MGNLTERITHAVVLRTGRSAVSFLRLLARWERANADGAIEMHDGAGVALALYVRQARAMARVLDACAETIESVMKTEGTEAPAAAEWRPASEVPR